MAITQTDTSDSTSRTLDLGALVPALPRGTECVVRPIGANPSDVLEIERRGDTWVVEGGQLAAEVTAVYGDGETLTLPERVPGWIVAVLREEFGIDEVSIRY